MGTLEIDLNQDLLELESLPLEYWALLILDFFEHGPSDLLPLVWKLVDVFSMMLLRDRGIP